MVIAKPEHGWTTENKLEITVRDDLSPEELSEIREAHERCQRNWDWLEANAKEVYSHRGKYICIAGQELFVGDDVLEVLARARAAHPKDTGMFTRIIPKERGPRIYAHRRKLEAV